MTEFFRDPEAWQVLRERVLPEIVEMKTMDTKPVIRIWSAGCVTGQEAYSVAILLDQLLEERKDDLKVHPHTKTFGVGVNIWGIDIDRESLLNAQQAEYKPDLVKGVPKNILNKDFDFNDNFRVKYYIRGRIHFKFHDLVLNEPLSGMDLILCRNVAIYFERPLQEKIFMDFYNGLNQKGYLFLGKAETLIGPAQERFKTIDKRWRIYQKERSLI